MAIDPNEIGGFIGACTNAGLLEQLALVIEQRLRKLNCAQHPAMSVLLAGYARDKPEPSAVEQALAILRDRENRTDATVSLQGRAKSDDPLTMEEVCPAESPGAAPSTTSPTSTPSSERPSECIW